MRQSSGADRTVYHGLRPERIKCDVGMKSGAQLQLSGPRDSCSNHRQRLCCPFYQSMSRDCQHLPAPPLACRRTPGTIGAPWSTVSECLRFTLSNLLFARSSSDTPLSLSFSCVQAGVPQSAPSLASCAPACRRSSTPLPSPAPLRRPWQSLSLPGRDCYGQRATCE